jgi:6-methylsalicylate decarboxylase
MAEPPAPNGHAGAIDLHAHFLASGYRKALAAAGVDALDGMPGGVPAWSPGSALELMGQAGVGTSVLSISSPGVLLDADDRAAATLATRVNDEAAEIVRASPAAFRFVASLPLPDLPAALAELTRALDDLTASGVLLLSNYRGIYLGDPRFEPLFEELDRRQALVVIHPTAPCTGAAPDLGWPAPLLEFVFDTTRAVTSLVLNGVVDRYPGVRYVVPHGGSALPALADRIGRVSTTLNRFAGEEPVDVRRALRGLWYDVAGGEPQSMLPALLALADPVQLVYGSDYPFTPAARVRQLSSLYRETELLTEPQRQGLFRDNALRLLAAPLP